jgi:hypothetical protein
LFFKKNAKLFAENWQKSQIIVIITSTMCVSMWETVLNVIKCISTFATINPDGWDFFYWTVIHHFLQICNAKELPGKVK